MRMGDMLIKAGVVSAAQLQAALAEQQRAGGKLGQILVRMGALSEELLVMALCRQLDLPRANLDAVPAVPELLRARLDRGICEQYCIVPLAFITERRTVQLAMADPFDVVAVDALTTALGTGIEPFLAGEQAIRRALRRLYGGEWIPPPPPPPPTEPSFRERVDEQARFVHAVQALLLERGVLQPEDLLPATHTQPSDLKR